MTYVLFEKCQIQDEELAAIIDLLEDENLLHDLGLIGLTIGQESTLSLMKFNTNVHKYQKFTLTIKECQFNIEVGHG